METNNFSHYTEGNISDSVLDLQFNLLYMPIQTETSDATTTPNASLDYEDESEEQSEEVSTDDPADEQQPEEEPYVYTYNIITNFQIYDIPKRSKSMLFKGGELEESCAINNLYFEQAYDEKGARMLFATSFYNVRNNYNIPEREPKNKLLIEVINNRKAENQLWICDKWGFAKQCIVRWSTNSELSWHLDMFNEVIRVMTYDGNNWNIMEYPW